MIVNSYLYNFMPIRYVFGKGFTIFYRLCEWGGNEIHVNASKPIRKECLNLMNNIGGVWWTSIEPSNQKAINLCLKCGFEFHSEVNTVNPYNSDSVTLNIYKRCENVPL